MPSLGFDGLKEFKATENSTIASVESTTTASKAYNIGDFFWYAGKLYKATAPIASGATITIGTNCSLAPLANDVSALKSALGEITGNAEIPVTDTDKYIDLTGETADINNPSTTTRGFNYSLVQCSPGDAFTVSAVGETSARAYGFIGNVVNGVGDVLQPVASSGGTVSELLVIAPANAEYLVINDKSGAVSYYGMLVKEQIKSNTDEITNIGEIVYNNETKSLSGETPIQYHISPSTGLWAKSTSASTYILTLPFGIKKLSITPNATSRTILAVLTTDSHANGTSPNYATGWTRTSILGSTVTYDLPSDAHYLWITGTLSGTNYDPESIVYIFAKQIPTVDNTLTQSGEAADAKVTGDKFLKVFCENLNTENLSSGTIQVSSGATSTSTAGQHTGYIDVGDYSKLKYTRITTTNSTAAWGMTFYDVNKDHIENTGQYPILSAASFGFVLADIDVPQTAKYARFTWSNTLNASDFAVYGFDAYNASIEGQIETLKSYHPSYSGKKLSILGDSISTFVPSADKVDGKAPEGCTTNYPGNVVQYENSNVTSVDLTWWGKVLDYFGMTLGINESWAGSCIGYNPNSTSSGKYTADNCLCSETRIGHLGENGTPDLIIVFGGTNDINHHRVSNGSTLRYAVGELDSEHNPYNFDNFPMITDTYYGSITTMLLRIQHSYPNATILMLLPYFCTYTHTSSGDIASPSDQSVWCKAAIDVCNYLGVEYLDLRNIINLYDVSSLLFDGLHPKANGMAAIAKAVIHKLNNMF